MDDYNNELSYGASESRYAEIRAQREQRRQARVKQKTPEKTKRVNANHLPPTRGYSPYDEPLYDDDDFYSDRPKGSFAKVLLTQAAVCVVLIGLLFLAQGAMPNTYRQLKRSYEQAMQTDMSAREVWAAAQAVLNRLRDDIYVIAPYREPETTAAATGEEEPLNGTGGFDLALELAAKSATALPLKTTVPPLLPVDGMLTSSFGYRIHPISGEEGVHTGMDIAAPEGTPIHAAFFGTVSEVGVGEAFGNYVIIDHAGGMQTAYAHCSEIFAEEGIVLRAGDLIALVGSTGISTGPHLHFEIRLGGLRVNPEPLFLDAFPLGDII